MIREHFFLFVSFNDQIAYSFASFKKYLFCQIKIFSVIKEIDQDKMDMGYGILDRFVLDKIYFGTNNLLFSNMVHIINLPMSKLN